MLTKLGNLAKSSRDARRVSRKNARTMLVKLLRCTLGGITRHMSKAYSRKPSWSDFRAPSGEFDYIWRPIWALGPDLPRFGDILPRLARICQKFGRHHTDHGEIRPKSESFWPASGKRCPTLARRPTSDKSDQLWPDWVKTCPNFAETN